MKTDTISMKHEYTDSELAGLSREISNAFNAKNCLEKEFDGVRQDYKAQITAKEAVIASLSARISGGFEMQSIKCLLLDERPAGYRLVVRLDTGHVYRRRKLDPEERQIKITDQAPPEYVATALLRVDDEGWDVDVAQVPLYLDELEALRELADVTIQVIGNRSAGQIEAPGAGPEKPKKGGGR